MEMTYFRQIIAAPVTMLLLQSTAVSADPSWGEPFTNNMHRTANTAVRISRVIRNTASSSAIVTDSSNGSDLIWQEPLRALRTNLHATVQQLACAIGVTRQSVHAWQRGEKDPSAENQRRIMQLEEIARRLNSSIGNRLPVLLNLPMRADGSTFWDLISNPTSNPKELADSLIKLSLKSTERRFALRQALNGKLPAEPLDFHR
jgi:transcriptional regulator with XRE-family HTH domain